MLGLKRSVEGADAGDDRVLRGTLPRDLSATWRVDHRRVSEALSDERVDWMCGRGGRGSLPAAGGYANPVFGWLHCVVLIVR